MTALPLRDFTDAERERLTAIEAAPAAEEGVTERVARAMCGTDVGRPLDDDEWQTIDPFARRSYCRLADAALAVLSGPSSDAERAVERVAGVITFVDECVAFSPARRKPIYEDIARRLRAAVAGES